MFVLNWFWTWTTGDAVVVVAFNAGSMLAAQHVRRRMHRR